MNPKRRLGSCDLNKLLSRVSTGIVDDPQVFYVSSSGTTQYLEDDDSETLPEDIWIYNGDSSDCYLQECYFMAAGCSGNDLATIGPLSFSSTYQVIVDVSQVHAMQEYCLKCKFTNQANGNGGVEYKLIDNQFVIVA